MFVTSNAGEGGQPSLHQKTSETVIGGNPPHGTASLGQAVLGLVRLTKRTSSAKVASFLQALMAE